MSAEISSGGLTAILGTAGKESKAFAQFMRMSVDELENLINTNPNEFLLQLANNFKGASNTEIVQTLEKLKIGSQEAAKVLLLLSNNTEFVREKQALANAEFQKGTSLLNEFNIKNETFAANLEKVQKWAMGLLMAGFQPLVNGLAALINYTSEATKNTDGLTRTYNEQKRIVESLNTTTTAQLKRYDELKSKTTLTKDEQTELKNIIVQVTSVIPSAIAEFDKYGNILDINATKARTFIEGQKLLGKELKDTTKTALESELKNLQGELVLVEDNLKTGQERVGKLSETWRSFKGVFTGEVKLEEDINNERAKELMMQRENIMELIKQRKAELDALNGTAAPTDKVTPNTTQGDFDFNPNEKNQKDKLAKLLEEKNKAIAEAQKNLNELQIKLMDEGAAKELAALESRYSELGLKVAEAMEKGLPKDLGNAQLELLTQNFDKEKEGVLEKWRKIGEEQARSEWEGKQNAKQKLFDKEVGAVEVKKNTNTATENLDFLNKSTDLAAQAAGTDDTNAKQAIQVALEDLEFLHKQKLLSIEETFLKDKLAINEKYGVLTTEQVDVLNKDVELLNAQRTANEVEENNRRTEVNRNGYRAILTAAGSFTNSLGQLQEAIGEDGGAWIDFKNAITLAQIAIDTASAISSLTSASSANPSNAVTFGAAGAAQFAAGIVKITANIAQAYKVLEGGKKPKAPKSKAADAGGYFFEGGKLQPRLAEGYTGGNSIYEPIPFIGHGGEYIVNNRLMQQPPVANFTAMMESARLTKRNITYEDIAKLLPDNYKTSNTSNNSTTTNSADNQANALLQRLITLQEAQIQATQNFGGRLRVVATDVQTGLDEINQLDKEANF